jgi:hypothetical protein
MADATQRLVLLLEGKADSAKRAISDTEKSVEGASKRIASSGQRIASFGKALGSAFVALGAAAFLKKGVENALAAEVSTTRLKNAVENTGVAYESQEKAIKATIRAQSDLAAISGGQVRDALTNLVQVTGDVTESETLLADAADLARAKKMDLGKAATLVGRVHEGNTGILKRYGIVLADNATAEEALAAMRVKFGGAAEAYGKTTQGQMDRATIAVSRLQTTIGTAMLPTLGRFASTTADLLTKFDALPQNVKDGTIAVAGIGTAALIAAPYITTLGKGVAFMGNAMKGLAGANIAASIGGIGAAAGEAAAAIALLAEGGSVGALVGMGGAAAGATIGVAALAASVAGLAGYGLGTLLTKIPGVNSALTAMGVAIAGVDDNYNALERTIYGLGDKTVAYTEAERNAASASQKAQWAAAVAADKNKALGIATDGAAGAADDQAAAIDATTRAMNGAMVAADDYSGKQRTMTEADLANRTAKLDLKAAQTAATEATRKHGAKSDEAKRAQIALASAELRAKDAAYDYKKAAEEAAKTPKINTAPITRAKNAWEDAMVAAANYASRAHTAIEAANPGSRHAGPANQASGSITAPRPGGVFQVVAEAGDYEATIPINRSERSLNLLAETMGRMGLSAPAQGGGVVQKFYGSRIDADWMAEAARRALMAPAAPSIA